MSYKILEIADLKKMDIKGLMEESAKAKIDLANRKIHVRLGEDKKLHMVKNLKNYISRMNTIITSKKHEK